MATNTLISDALFLFKSVNVTIGIFLRTWVSLIDLYISGQHFVGQSFTGKK